jgi:hypothetical protein
MFSGFPGRSFAGRFTQRAGAAIAVDCVTIIQVMAGLDREGARKLFRRWEQAQPAQPLARQMFGPLFAEPEVKE